MLKYIRKGFSACGFERPADMDPLIYELLCKRGVSSAEEAKKFLNPTEDDLFDPMLLNDIDKAVEMINNAVQNEEHICIFGDYDADGVCSCAIMTHLMNRLNADFEVYIPSRHNEGYGLNMAAVEELAARSKLMITVDCGISSIQEIEHAKELGMKCIVTDHHRPGGVLPNCPVVNPLLNNYPFPWLCGAGTAFKLTHALLGKEEALQVIDIAAIATIADIVSLTGENRCIVKLGLERINQGLHPGITELIRNAGITDREVKSEDIAFRLGPRLNAGGRLGSAYRSYELLIAENEFEAVSGADVLEQANSKRKQIQEEIISEALVQLQDFDFLKHRIIMIQGSDWDHGVIGLAASHIQKLYHFPTIVFAEKDGLLTGSCRSIPGIDIYKMLSSASDLMVKFGGHSQAAGLTIQTDNFEMLWNRLDDFIRNNCEGTCYIPTAEYDMELPVNRLDIELIEKLELLEPFGCDNPRPIFRDRPELIEKKACGSQRNHLQLIASSEGKRIKGICYGAGVEAETPCGISDILYMPVLNVWQGRINVEMQVKELQDVDRFAAISSIDIDTEEQKCNFLTEIVYNKKYKFDGEVPFITRRDLGEQLCNTVQGICVICGDIQQAVNISELFGTEAPDISIAKFTKDIRGFNSIAVCPTAFEDLPASVHTVVFAGLPAPVSIREGLEVFRLEGVDGIDLNIPTIDEMREVYKALRRITHQPAHFRNQYLLDREIAISTGLSVEACCLSRLALMSMELVVIKVHRQVQLIVPPAVKKDPNNDPVWCSIEKLREN